MAGWTRRATGRGSMRLDDWIKRVGDQKASEVLGVAARTCRSYRRHERYPPSALCRKLPRLTGNLVTTLHDVFGGELPTEQETFRAESRDPNWTHDTDPERQSVVNFTGNPFAK